MAKRLEIEDAAEIFVGELGRYFVDFELRDSDRRHIAGMFRRVASKCVIVEHEKLRIIKEPVEIKVPVYVEVEKIIYVDSSSNPENTDSVKVDPELIRDHPQRIIDYVANATGIPGFNSRNGRKSEVVRAKRIAVYLMFIHCKQLTLEAIGEHFVGDRSGQFGLHHTTIIHHIREARNQIIPADEDGKQIIVNYEPEWKKVLKQKIDEQTQQRADQ